MTKEVLTSLMSLVGRISSTPPCTVLTIAFVQLDIVRVWKLDVRKVVEETQVGRIIVSEKVLQAIKSEGLEPMGKLLMRKHMEEVDERDGRDGRDLWCALGLFVYDLTGENAVSLI